MSKNYLKLQNQGNIYQNLMLLNEMHESSGYTDENGYFSKRSVAEIAINSAVVTSAGKMGDDIMDLVNDTVSDESRNSVLQNAKARMQILRALGLVASDYDAELYAITDFGEKVLAQVFPASAEEIPDYRLLRESFMGISSTSEIYDYNCDINFNCYLGYAICYALSNLDYRISVQEMPCITTYDIADIDSFVETVNHFRSMNQQIPNTYEHFPKTQQGKPLVQAGNITRTINQILRICNIFERKNVRINGVNYYVCTDYGKKYVDEIKRTISHKHFWTPQFFRKKNLLSQKRICNVGYNNILDKGGYDIPFDAKDNATVFSPYQLIPETNVNWLLEKNIRKAPISKETQVQIINSQIATHTLRLKPVYRTQAEYDEFIKTYTSKTTIIQEILRAKSDGKEKTDVIEQFMERHKNSDKELFYPFVHSLIGALGLDCLGETGRYDALIKYKDIMIPMEIKSYTETPSYNMKGVRQALENKICIYKEESDLKYASLLLGYSRPTSITEIQDFIDAAFDEWGMKLIAMDLRTLVEMCVRTVWDEQILDFESMFQEYGIAEA
jgi:hypothetical protein